ncbi:MAG TPA: phospho-N-acetylmuramoyl-pentapeptide-transferase, partial [Rhabdochlamydiaceae bacterium]|nr:phospho-N-acetylmuramoyl-pentapeptide-transferase [Rhabdochlamydiaceae bacterium]
MKIPSVFTYTSSRMLLAALTTLLLVIFLGPRVIRKLYELKTGQSIRVDDCPLLVQLHEKKKDTPTMGGILILSSMLIALLLWMDLKSSITLILFVTTIWLGLLGGVDDYLKLKYKNSKGLRAKKKFLLQVLLGALISLYLYWPAASNALNMGSWFEPPSAREQIVQVKKEGVKNEISMISLTTQQYIGQYFIPFVKDPVFTLT